MAGQGGNVVDNPNLDFRSMHLRMLCQTILDQ